MIQAFLAYVIVLIVYIVLAMYSVIAQTQGSCWQCMHGCGGRDAEVCGKSGTMHPFPQIEVEVSTEALKKALVEYNASNGIQNYDRWNKVVRELNELERAIQLRLRK